MILVSHILTGIASLHQICYTRKIREVLLITIAPMNGSYLHRLWEIGYRQAAPRWKEFAAPYFDDYQACTTFEEFQALELY